MIILKSYQKKGKNRSEDVSTAHSAALLLYLDEILVSEKTFHNFSSSWFGLKQCGSARSTCCQENPFPG